MPISSQVPIIGYVANGVTKSFAFPFAILSADDLKVKVGADVVTTGFSIAGVGNRNGGSVTFTDAPASSIPIILYREVTLDRTTDYQENGDLLAIVLDDDLDRIWMALQDQLLLSDRALRSPLGETLQQLPPASERALMALAFDAAGNPIVVRGTNDGGAALALDLLDTAPGKGAALVGFRQNVAGAVPLTVEDELRNRVNVRQFGAVGNGSVNDTTAFSDALSYCKANGRTLIIPDGNYLLTAGVLNFAAQGLNIIGTGRPTLTYTGAGVAFSMDTGLVDGAFLEEMRVENLLIVGNPSTTTGFYSRGIVRSVFRNIEVRECSTDAFDIRHGVSNTYDSFRYSAQGHTTKALRGMRLRANGAGYYTADCTFINLVSEDFAGSGLYIEAGSGNTFIGGTFEGCDNGAVILSGCRRNKLNGVWFEANISKDLSDDGVANAYDDCYFGSASRSPSAVMGTAQGAVFKGGYLRTIQLDSTSRDTLFIGVGMDENLSGTLGITGTGTYKSVGMTKVNGTGAVVGQMQDFVGNEGTWTPVDASGAGLTFTGANGYYTKIGKLVFAQGTVTFPATANASAASIGGLPFTVPSLAGARQGFVSFTDETTLFSILPDGGGTTISLRNSSAAALTNATMSGNTVWFTAIYFT